jgi:hypothetical protein
VPTRPRTEAGNRVEPREPRPGNRLTPERWTEARLAWEADHALSFAKLAKTIGVSGKAVQKAAKREGWYREGKDAPRTRDRLHEPPAAPLPSGDPAEINLDGVRPPAPVQPAPPKPEPGSVAARREVILQRHRQSWHLVNQLYLGAFDLGMVERDGQMVRTVRSFDAKKLAAARVAAQALEAMQRGERASWEEEQLPDALDSETTYITEFVNSLPPDQREQLRELERGRGGLPPELAAEPPLPARAPVGVEAEDERALAEGPAGGEIVRRR